LPGHPLLGESCEPALASEPTRVWETSLSVRRLPYLAAHKVWGGIVLPAPRVWRWRLPLRGDVARKAGGGSRSCIRDAFAARLGPAAPRSDNLGAARIETEFSLFCRDASQPWKRCATGKAGPSLVRRRERPRHSRRVAGRVRGLGRNGIMPRRRRAGWSTGRSSAASGSSGGGMAKRWGTSRFRPVSATAGTTSIRLRSTRRFRWWPRPSPATPPRICRPASRGGAFLRRRNSFWCRASLRGEPGAARLEADLALFGDDGRLIAQLDGLALARVSGAAPLADALIGERWEPLQLAAGAGSEGRWVIRGDAPGIRERWPGAGRRYATAP